MHGKAWRLAWVMSVVGACSAHGSESGNPVDAGFADDAPVGADAGVDGGGVTVTDVPVGSDVVTGADVPMQADVPVGTDVTVGTDVGTDVGFDVPPAVDVPVAMDAGATSTPSQQIAAVRATPVGTAALRVDGAVVTYVVAATLRGDGTVSPSDPAGFFVQAERTGPALFVAVDPLTLSPVPAVGDRVGFTVTRVSSPTPATHWAAEIGGYVRSATGVAVAPLLQDVSNAPDLVTNLLDYEHELVTLTATVTSDFASGGTNFLQASIATAGLPADPLLKVRMPPDVRTAAGLRVGCRFVINGTPMWRYDATAQAGIWTARDVSSVSCPPPMIDAGFPDVPRDAGFPDVPRDTGSSTFDVGPMIGDDQLWVTRVGDGLTALAGAATPVFVESYNGATGATGATIALPTVATGSNLALTLSGTATSEGNIARSANGAWATIGGYNFPVGTLTPNTATGPRVIARISPAGAVDTRTSLGTTDDHSAIRAVVSTDGTEFWSIHANSSFGEVTYTGFLGSPAATPVSNQVVLRGLVLFGSQLLVSGDNPAPAGSGISATASLPRAAGSAVTRLPGFPNDSSLSPYGFTAFDRDGNGAPDVLFIADDRALLSGGGVAYWQLQAGTWVLVGNVIGATNPMRSVIGRTNGADYVLYGLTNEGRPRLQRFDFNTVSLTALVTTLAQAPVNTAYRGLTFAPR